MRVISLALSAIPMAMGALPDWVTVVKPDYWDTNPLIIRTFVGPLDNNISSSGDGGWSSSLVDEYNTSATAGASAQNATPSSGNTTSSTTTTTTSTTTTVLASNGTTSTTTTTVVTSNATTTTTVVATTTTTTTVGGNSSAGNVSVAEVAQKTQYQMPYSQSFGTSFPSGTSGSCLKSCQGQILLSVTGLLVSSKALDDMNYVSSMCKPDGSVAYGLTACVSALDAPTYTGLDGGTSALCPYNTVFATHTLESGCTARRRLDARRELSDEAATYVHAHKLKIKATSTEATTALAAFDDKGTQANYESDVHGGLAAVSNAFNSGGAAFTALANMLPAVPGTEGSGASATTTTKLPNGILYGTPTVTKSATEISAAKTDLGTWATDAATNMLNTTLATATAPTDIPSSPVTDSSSSTSGAYVAALSAFALVGMALIC